MDVDFQNMFERIMPKQNQQRQVPVREARRVLLEQETEALIDQAVVTEKAVELVENQGIIFLDELDKVCGPSSAHGPDVSRQGVQRDLLPVVEGTTVNTARPGADRSHPVHRGRGVSPVEAVRPDAGIAGPLPDPRRADRPEARRFPAHPDRAEARADASSTPSLLATEGVTLEFTPDGIEALADIAFEVNRTTQNIGARRLHTILERVVEEISYLGPDQLPAKRVRVDARLRARSGWTGFWRRKI